MGGQGEEARRARAGGGGAGEPGGMEAKWLMEAEGLWAVGLRAR